MPKKAWYDVFLPTTTSDWLDQRPPGRMMRKIGSLNPKLVCTGESSAQVHLMDPQSGQDVGKFPHRVDISQVDAREAKERELKLLENGIRTGMRCMTETRASELRQIIIELDNARAKEAQTTTDEEPQTVPTPDAQPVPA